jgi:hypothetical protein
MPCRARVLFPVSVAVEEPAIASVVAATGATIAAAAAAKTIFRNMTVKINSPPADNH